MPKVSVLMGVYNNEGTIQRSINSIIHQSFTDWEFIICDDGSTDGTYEALQQLARLDSRINVIKNHQNMGVAHAVNETLRYASGEYIARMDGDDYSHPDRFRIQVEFLDRNPEIAFISNDIRYVDDDGAWGERHLKAYPEPRDFLRTCPFIQPTLMMRRSALQAVDGYRVAKVTRRAEDYDLFMRLYAKGYKGCNLSMKLLDYTEDKNAYSKRKYKYRIDEMVVRYSGFRALGLLPWSLPFVVQPLLMGLLPRPVIQLIKRRFSL